VPWNSGGRIPGSGGLYRLGLLVLLGAGLSHPKSRNKSCNKSSAPSRSPAGFHRAGLQRNPDCPGLLRCRQSVCERMDDDLARQLIRHRLQDGRLPRDRVVHVWEMPGNGHACDGCGLPLARNQRSVCGIAARGLMWIQFHADCFVIWESERLEPFLQVVGGRHL
jgi:hypothetical protein